MLNHGRPIKTEEDVYTAFRRESIAKNRYLECAEKAEKEGYFEAAKLFRATAEAEAIHAQLFLRALHERSTATTDLWAPLGGNYSTEHSTEENLKDAINESHELSTMYEQMVQDAEKDGDYWALAKECFTYARAVDEVHAALFDKTLHNLDRTIHGEYYVCEACGNTVTKKPDNSCNICGSSKSAFHIIK